MNSEDPDNSHGLPERILINEIDEILNMSDGESPTNTLMRLFTSVFRESFQMIQTEQRDTSRVRYQRRFIDIHRRFSSEEYSMARDEFKNMCETDEARAAEIPTRILNVLIDYYYDHDCEEWPSQQDIVRQLQTTPCGCIFSFAVLINPASSCFQNYNSDEIEDMLYYYVFSEARLPSCEELRPIMEYNSLSGRFPTTDELREYVVNTLSFFNNPEEYYQHDKVHHPVSHPERIPVLLCPVAGVGCGICQDDIQVGQKMIKLKDCNHCFHAEDSECLGSSSIFTWFENECVCPMCKTQVKTSEPTTPL